jgi:hypothetical protein
MEKPQAQSITMKSSHLKPIDTELPEIGRNQRQRHKKGADEEGAGCPVDFVERDAAENRLSKRPAAPPLRCQAA